MRSLARSAFLTSLFFIGLNSAAMAEPTYIQKMDAEPAKCRIVNMTSGFDVDAVAKKYGQNSKQWTKAFSDQIDKVRACVDSAKENGKSFYKAEVERLPLLRQQLSEAYVAWLENLDHLTAPESEADAYKRAYERATNRLKAELDTM